MDGMIFEELALQTEPPPIYAVGPMVIDCGLWEVRVRSPDNPQSPPVPQSLNEEREARGDPLLAFLASRYNTIVKSATIMQAVWGAQISRTELTRATQRSQKILDAYDVGARIIVRYGLGYGLLPRTEDRTVRILLNRQGAKLVRLFAPRAGAPVSPPEICRTLFGPMHISHELEHRGRVAVLRLRKQLGEIGCAEYLHTVVEEGYGLYPYPEIPYRYRTPARP